MTYRFPIALLALCTLSMQAQAIDDFGPRFTNQAPAGFSNPAPSAEPENVNNFIADMTDLAAQLQNIAPAAGEEQLDTSIKTKAATNLNAHSQQ